MAKIIGPSLMMDEDEVRITTSPLPRLLRVIFYGERITNDDYFDRYFQFATNLAPNKTRKERTHKLSSDRNACLDRTKITFKTFHYILHVMGYDLESISVRLRHQDTGEISEFSTDDTVEKLNERLNQEKDIGIDSL